MIKNEIAKFATQFNAKHGTRLESRYPLSGSGLNTATGNGILYNDTPLYPGRQIDNIQLDTPFPDDIVGDELHTKWADIIRNHITGKDKG